MTQNSNPNNASGAVHNASPLTATGTPTPPAASPQSCERCASLDDLDITTLGNLDHDTVEFIARLYDALVVCDNDPAANAPLPQQWEHLQAALDTLHAALGGRHMGDYPPDQSAIDQAIIEVIVRLAMMGIQAERLNRMPGDSEDGS